VTSTVRPFSVVPMSFAKRLLRVIAVVLVFVLIGPPVGALILLLTVAAFNMADPDLAGLSWVAIFALLYGVPVSYLFGALPAATAGLLVGLWQNFVGRPSWLLALGVGLIVGVGYLYGAGHPPPDASAKEFEFWEYPPIFVLSCVGPTMLCWLIVRNWFQPGPSAVSA
jgi:hypothetical protein